MHVESVSFRDTPCIRIANEGASALVALHGGHVLSWVAADGRERLFLGARSRFDGASAIRGGIPVIFPQFSGRGRLGRHGFARTAPWAFAGVEADAAVFELADDGTRFHGWGHPCMLRLRVTLGAMALQVALEVDNSGHQPLAFTAALHTYLRVDDIAFVVIEGLQGCDFEDSAAGGTLHRQHDHEVTFDNETDRIYADVVTPLTLIDGARRLAIEQQGFADVVAWNPGAALASTIADLAAGEYRQFACVEAAQVLQPAWLAPGQRWQGWQRLQAQP